MPIAAILSIGSQGLGHQWYSDKERTRHEELLGWNRVVEAEVFKRDLFTYDLMCLRFLTESGGIIEVDEEDANWQVLVEALPDYLPGTTAWSEWYTSVAFPAFEAKAQTIFKRIPK